VSAPSSARPADLGPFIDSNLVAARHDQPRIDHCALGVNNSWCRRPPRPSAARLRQRMMTRFPRKCGPR